MAFFNVNTEVQTHSAKLRSIFKSRPKEVLTLLWDWRSTERIYCVNQSDSPLSECQVNLQDCHFILLSENIMKIKVFWLSLVLRYRLPIFIALKTLFIHWSFWSTLFSMNFLLELKYSNFKDWLRKSTTILKPVFINALGCRFGCSQIANFR